MTDAALRSSIPALGPEVIAFRDQEGLKEDLATAIELACKHFRLQTNPVVTLEQDPELDNHYIVLGITTRGETAEIVAAHKNYAREWATRVPWPKSSKIKLN